MENQIKDGILQMAMGAIQERFDYECDRVVKNILDPNTDEKAKRSITLTVEFKPTQDRRVINISATAKSKIAPATAIETTAAITSDEMGEMILAEMTPQVPGQMDLDGNEQEKPKIMRLAKA